MRRLLSSLTVVVSLCVPAAAAGAPSLVRVRLDAPRLQVPVLQRAGLDVTEHVRPRHADVVLHDSADRAALRRLGYPYRVRVGDLAAAGAAARRADARAARRGAASDLPSGRETYRVYADYLRDLDALVARAPGLVRRVVLPRRSVDGREIVGVEVARDVNRADDGRPVYVVMGAHHAREWPSAEVTMELALDLVRAYGSDPRITGLLDRLRVYAIPVINPDGFIVSREGGAGTALRRKNCRPTGAGDGLLACGQRSTTSGVDLNRNYGAYWGGNGASTAAARDTYRGPQPWSEPEAEAVHEFSRRLHITNLQTLHNVAALVLRPPGFEALGLAPDEARLKALGDAMAAAAGYESRYGYELYEVTGAAEDWNYVAQGAFGYTIELGGDGFQGPYRENVIDQYLGAPGTPQAGKGVREALLLAGEQAADPADHAILRGVAPAGRTLRLRRAFETATSPVCGSDLTDAEGDCMPRAGAMALDDGLDTTLTVPADGRFTWHVNPSTRPFEAKAGRTEAWTLTCESAAGVHMGQEVVVGRGQVVEVAPCGPVATQQAPREARPARRTAPRVRFSVSRAPLRTLLRRGLLVRASCSETCRATAVARVGRRVVARRARRLRAGRSTAYRLRFTGRGRRVVAGSAGRRLEVSLVVTAKSGLLVTRVRRVGLR